MRLDIRACSPGVDEWFNGISTNLQSQYWPYAMRIRGLPKGFVPAQRAVAFVYWVIVE